MMNTSDVVAEEFPESSMAVQVTVVVPSAKEVMSALIATLSSARSVAVASVSVGVVEAPVAKWV